ncbi:hypothetical protein GCM10023238_39330 [Streptomyces heliomycini]
MGVPCNLSDIPETRLDPRLGDPVTEARAPAATELRRGCSCEAEPFRISTVRPGGRPTSPRSGRPRLRSRTGPCDARGPAAGGEPAPRADDRRRRTGT